MPISEELKQEIIKSKPVVLDATAKAESIAYSAAVQKLRVMAKTLCTTVCAYLEDNPGAVLVDHDGSVYDIADESAPIKVGEA